MNKIYLQDINYSIFVTDCSDDSITLENALKMR